MTQLLDPSQPAPDDVLSRWVRWGVECRQQHTEFKTAYDRLDEFLCSRFNETPPSPKSGAA